MLLCLARRDQSVPAWRSRLAINSGRPERLRRMRRVRVVGSLWACGEGGGGQTTSAPGGCFSSAGEATLANRSKSDHVPPCCIPNRWPRHNTAATSGVTMTSSVRWNPRSSSPPPPAAAGPQAPRDAAERLQVRLKRCGALAAEKCGKRGNSQARRKNLHGTQPRLARHKNICHTAEQNPEYTGDLWVHPRGEVSDGRFSSFARDGSGYCGGGAVRSFTEITSGTRKHARSNFFNFGATAPFELTP